MNASDSVGSVRGTAGTPEGAPDVPSIVRSFSNVHIDAGSSTLEPDIMSPSRSSTLPVQFVSPMSPAEKIHHEGALLRAQRRGTQVLQLPVQQANPREAARTQRDIELLKGHLQGRRGAEAVELFGAISQDLCTAQFLEEGHALREQTFEYIQDVPFRARRAWHGAAQLYEASGHVDHALGAYSQELALLKLHNVEPATQQMVQNRMLELRGFITPVALAQAGGTHAPFAPVHASLHRGDPAGAEVHLMNALTQPLSRQQEVLCLGLAGDIKTRQGQHEHAARLYLACISHAHQYRDGTEAALQVAGKAIEKLKPELDAELFEEGVNSQEAFDNLLMQSARYYTTNEDFGPAIRLYDSVIPRLAARNDKGHLAEALLYRRNASGIVEDGKWGQLNLNLALAYNGTGRRVAAAFCLDTAFGKPDALDCMGELLKVASAVLTSDGDRDAAQWCNEASSRPCTKDDLDTLSRHITDLLDRMQSRAVQQALVHEFGPMLEYAESLLDNESPDDVSEYFNEVLQAMHEADVDTGPAAIAIEDRMREATSETEATSIIAEVRLTIADMHIREQRFAEAAENLAGVLDLNLSEQAELLRNTVHGAVRLAVATDRTEQAVYLLEAASLYEQKNDLELTETEVLELPARWEEALLPHVVGTIKDDARIDAEGGFDQMEEVAREVIRAVMAEAEDRSDTPRLSA